jgi:hypothetical protein
MRPSGSWVKLVTIPAGAAGVPGYAMTPNRSVLYTKPELRLVRAGVPLRQGCLCGARSRSVHEKMIASSRYARLSR